MPRPSLASRFATVTPMPGRTSSARSSRSGRGVDREGCQRSGGSTPVKPAAVRIGVITTTRAGPSIGTYWSGRTGADASSVNQKKPTVPGPACVPTTAPSVVTISICAFGRSPATILRSCSAFSGASACAMPTRRWSVSNVESTNCCWNSANALAAPRTRFSGMTSPFSIVRIGFTCSSCPANFAARPIRPPRWRNSSVSTVKRIAALSLKRVDERVDLLVGRAALEPALDREAEHRLRRRRRARVDRAHLVAELLGRDARALDRSRERLRDVDREDALVGRRAPCRSLRSRPESAVRSPESWATCATARRTRAARARCSRGTSRRRSGRTAGPSASSGSARLPPGSRRSNRERPRCSARSGSRRLSPAGAENRPDDLVEVLVFRQAGDGAGLFERLHLPKVRRSGERDDVRTGTARDDGPCRLRRRPARAADSPSRRRRACARRRRARRASPRPPTPRRRCRRAARAAARAPRGRPGCPRRGRRGPDRRSLG